MQLSNLQETQKLWKKSSEGAAFVNQLYEILKKHNIKQQRDWYLNDRFVRGEHWIVFNKTTNRIQTIPLSDWEVRRTINKIRTQIRGVKNFVKKNQPRWQAEPKSQSEEHLNEAIQYNKILQYFYNANKFRSLITDLVVNSLKYSVWIIEGGLVKTDEWTALKFWVDDTFDIFFDPYGTDKDSCRFILKAIKKSVTSVKENKNYTIDWELTWDWREAASDYKDVLQKEKYNTQEKWQIKDLESIILKELWIKYTDKDGKTKVKVLTVAGNQIIRDRETSYKRLPFFVYNPEKYQNSIYSDPWIKDLISPNKSLDKMASQIESYIQRMLGGKMIIKQWVEVTTVTDKWAEKIYYKGNTAPTYEHLQPLPSAPLMYANTLERWIEEFGGMREASLGRAPGSLQSGKGLEALQAADASTVAEPIENLELLLQDIWEFILEVLAESQLTSKNIVVDNKDIKFIGKNSPLKLEWVTIVEPRWVTVKIVPEIAYTEEVKKDTLFKLAEMQLIDPETLLNYLSVSNVGDVIEKVKQNKEEEYKQEITKQRESHRTWWDWPNDSAEMADQENMQMAAGQEVPMTPRALWVPEHTQLHLAFIQENQDAYEQNKEDFDAHIMNEESYQ